MSVCPSCRLALRRAYVQSRTPSSQRSLSTKASSTSTAHQILSKPTWSIRSLLPSSSSPTPSETVTPSQLHHLLRLSALPLPKSPAEEQSMIATLQSQLQFVRAVQRVDTRGVEPLRAIRDETEQAQRENTIGLDALKEALDKETLVGYYKRPRRTRDKVESEAENWDALGTASRKAGRYFVVQSANKEATEASG